MSLECADEFNSKVKHNFKLYVLLTSRNIHWRQEYILETIYGLNGYKCHKTVKYDNVKSSHIHVKFEEEYMAKEAIDFLINLNSDLTAVLVDDMLQDWYNFERNCGFFQTTPWTITVVDITGDIPYGLNFLTEAILHSIFRDYSNPYVLPYTAALHEPHVQMMFGSMTEALAACMAFGEWYVRGRQMDTFSYRVRINPSDKEAMLISHSGGTPDEAFKLDYFVYLRNEPVVTCNEQCSKQKTSYDFLQNKGLKKIRKQKLSTMNIDKNLNRLNASVPNGNSIICVPIIAPFNSYAQALMASNKRKNVGETKNPYFLNNQNVKGTDEFDCLSSTVAENTIDCRSSLQVENTEAPNEDSVTYEQNTSDKTLYSVNDIKEKPDLIPPIVTMKQKKKGTNYRKGHFKDHGHK